jgi:hypothetical protein
MPKEVLQRGEVESARAPKEQTELRLVHHCFRRVERSHLGLMVIKESAEQAYEEERRTSHDVVEYDTARARLFSIRFFRWASAHSHPIGHL